ncbi:MAG: hypothetical protein JST80_12375 [Bdellovibrionales bacterium]|nr:hypothetical protein [Bdellovibrionales bacterium]
MKFSALILFSILLNLIVLPTQSHAYVKTPESICTPVDFREIFPLKMRNQHEMAWCYAHSASDYLQFTYNIPEQISAADIAINYSRSKWSKFVTFVRNVFNRDLRNEPPQTGLIKYAIQMILPQGYCPESALPSEEWTRVTPDGQSSKIEILQASLDLFDLRDQVQKKKFTTAAELPWRYDFKNVNGQQFFDILKNSTRKNVLLKLRAQACTQSRKPFPANANISMQFRLKGPHVFTRLNSNFDDAKMPITIDFFSDVLRHLDNPKKNINNMHTVLVYGRKFNTETNECYYMIKDSYGEQCDKYDPKIECDDGYVWLPENKVYKSLFSDLMIQRY